MRHLAQVIKIDMPLNHNNTCEDIGQQKWRSKIRKILFL